MDIDILWETQQCNNHCKEWGATFYTFNDIRKGDWINTEFGLDTEEFRKEFQAWFCKNTNILNSLGIHEHYLPE